MRRERPPAIVGAAYQVALPGEVGPAFLRPLSALGVGRSAASSVFLLRAEAGQGMSDIAARLQARGLVVLGIRRVSSPGADDDAAEAPVERDREDRPHTRPRRVTRDDAG